MSQYSGRFFHTWLVVCLAMAGCAGGGRAARTKPDGSSGDGTQVKPDAVIDGSRSDGSQGDGGGAQCGNGVVEGRESCDDGNTASGDGCSADCHLETCDAQSCPQGCCNQTGQCVNGAQDAVCGKGGQACQDCTRSNEMCHNQVCEALTGCDPGIKMDCGNCGQRTCANDRTWGGCEDEGVCGRGEIQELGTCGNCGTLQRVCQSDCTLGDAQCVNERICHPGDISTDGCGACQSKECSQLCSWGSCQTAQEVCNGQDDDCNGICDDGFACCQAATDSCTTSCGSTGTKTCQNGCTWGSCQPPSETCNGQDDNCDGHVDEGFRVDEEGSTFTVMHAYNAGCNGWGMACNNAIHQFCAGRNGCSVSGFGPVEANGDNMNLACVAGADVITSTYSELQGYLSSCTSATPASGACSAAIHRYCWDHGYASGFGPVYSADPTVRFICVHDGTVLNPTYTVLSTIQPSCDGTTERWGMYCNSAIRRWCQQQGYSSGYGPVENNGDACWVVCLTN